MGARPYSDLHKEKRISDLLLWNDQEAKRLMEEIAAEHGVAVDAIAELVAWERGQQEKMSRRGMTEVFDEVFDNKQYWK
ncbi:DNA modification system-associated small protein [Neisseria chenwenguii]|uniref:Uncharacterized protein n=1 Tax=Neisseria chenwenguii TaxID=1853278 RepID=A0A220S3M8_9NEIS|nr:DNA modification system-associated small protein [Neisseria chenwenguii]ASK28008.1 hypothetical protein BG910_09960 [Neisseria chenwenguii]ROV54478.1 hypothetical protein EGS38_10930 [Neisseria chenwenguii]